MAETRKQLIEWLETGQREFAHYAPEDKELFGNLPAMSRKFGEIARLLKEMEPKVLTYDEARNHAMQVMNPDSIKPVFIEFRLKHDSEEEERPPWRGGYNQRVMLANQKDRYGIDYRFWTDRPTIVQMEATPWN